LSDDVSQQTLVLSTKALTQRHYLETAKTPAPAREQPAYVKANIKPVKHTVPDS